jgi:predicted aldo/keto reductase-like oxidoreductase
MLYRTNGKNGEKLSQLAFGCMRLPRRGRGIDLEASQKLIDRAIGAGVNYFDTAWMYPGNEVAVGKLLAPYRARVNIATKMPMVLVKRPEDFDKYFAASLERLDTDRIEYYLLHMLTSGGDFDKFAAMGACEWAEREKARGRIGNFGFSFHGNAGSFRKIIDAYGWDFCMMQYNYIDTEYQAGKGGLRYAAANGVPVLVMEPLRGGKLVNLPTEARAVLDGAADNARDGGIRDTQDGLPNPAIPAGPSSSDYDSGITTLPAASGDREEGKLRRSEAEWGLRWVWNHPEVLTVLSGMNAPEQLEENLRIASDAKAGAMREEELDAVSRAAYIIGRSIKVPCTGCEYCLPCPKNVNIPAAFRYYNGDVFGSRFGLKMRYAMEAGILPDKPAFASQCVECGKCAPHCPQQIDIPAELKAARAELERFWSRPLAGIAKTFTTGRRTARQ